ncbi:superoxide dismutase [Sphingomonas sp. HITSZ_GF]|uniref:superoxide dismutase n=1 Tax=Sphingomonas sp. HITSZ_GF TaxID=3037247 RepID=UPI00240D156C|nr:superoxide dismutase [Sphingomonas sp. HITSZ_GF]MDG2532402.1 superoxide dismutase [Sphingomonas sp. HITSZ_GF]
MAFELPPLPFDKDALAPHMSAETLEFHHGKHHKAYVDKTNGFIAEKGLEGRKLSEVIAHAKSTADKGLFNNSAQIWNHSFFWQGLTGEKTAPSGKLAEMITAQYGSTDELVKKLIAESTNHFSNGWGWLVLDGDQLKVTSLHDADTPVVYEGMKPLLTIDVWEHAYYIDYRNLRPKYLETITANIINWDFVSQNLDGNGISRADQDS